MKTLSTGITTTEKRVNGILQIQVYEPKEASQDFININEFKYLMTLLSHLFSYETPNLSFDLNGYQCTIKDYRVTSLFINGQIKYLSTSNIKQINSLI